jgi:hypothetical protein
MRWKTPKAPKHGETRIVRRYACVPTNLSDGYTVWLESYYAVEQYQVSHYENYWELIETSSKHPNRPTTGTPTRKG